MGIRLEFATRKEAAMGWEYAWNSRKELIAHLCDEPTNYKTLARKVTSEDGESLLWGGPRDRPGRQREPGLSVHNVLPDAL